MPSRTINNLEAESSRKRARRTDADSGEDDDADEVQQARSNLVQAESQRKRVRVSTANDEESDKHTPIVFRAATPDFDHNALTSDSPQKTQYDLMRDNGFDHLRDEAADDQRATQRLRMGRPNLLGENVVAENGILESITCINFMCHTRLHVELGPLLNFIVGENGSGKSAILTAITLCLGGKASSTNRGGSLKSFIKEGCEKSVIAVKIKNQGQDAYRPETYGSSIIVERYFSRSGTSGFKIKSSHDGNAVSSKKQEVDEIVEYFALQVDNPLNVLSQDNARQFLNQSTKAQKYKFFIEGVQLQQLDNDYRLIAENIESAMAKIPMQEENLKHAQKQYEKASRMKEDLEGTRKLRDKLNSLRFQLVWAEVALHEGYVREREEKIAVVDAAIADLDQKLAAKNEELKGHEDKIAGYNKNLSELTTEQEAAKEDHEAAKAKFSQLKDETAKIHVSEREARGALKSTENDMKVTEKKIEDTQNKLAEANGGLLTEKRQQLEEEQAKIPEIEKKKEEIQSQKIPLDNKLADAKKALDEVQGALKRKQTEISQVEEQMKDLRGKEISLYAGYDAKMQALLRAIQNETRFESKPLGPLGSLIQLTKPEWGPIVESVLGSNLNGFLVTSSKDAKLLQELINRVGVKTPTPVLTGSKHPLDLEGKEPDAEYDTILRILKFDNPLVRDQFVIHAMIEQTILVAQRSRAQAIMYDGAPPRNVRACIAFHDMKRDEGVRIENRGNLGSSPIKPPPRQQKRRIRTDDASQMAYLQESYRQLEEDYKELGNQRRRAQQDVQRCQTEIQQRTRQEQDLAKQLEYAHEKIDRLKDELEDYEGNTAGQLEVLQDYLKELTEARELKGIQFGDLSVKKIEKNAEAEEMRKVVKEKRLIVEDVEARIKKVEEKITSRTARLRWDEGERMTILHNLNDLHERKAKQEKKLAVEKEKLEGEVLPGAYQIYDRRINLSEGETYETIAAKYQALDERYQKMKNNPAMDEDLVMKTFGEAMEACRRMDRLLKDTREMNDKLQQTLGLRLDKWRKFQRYISSQSRANFIYLLAERGFRGKLLLDHERKALDLQVEPDKTEKRAKGRSTKTLSGGEKSFSSICLLLAIWEAMGSPLRCLDEFDVFMDNVNRAISTNMLITAARRSVNRQYIFITPNAIEGRNTLDKDVKIIRLLDPRQRRIDEMTIH
ncbi:hypothetical protein QBC38DRAFT_389391 [Podospora fimiseda]|uniref:Structural maintenance of chromosomes protein 6 n=1 Tax=Podospora fimiseda TaxID=252190 RepID=A0AAN7BRH0_9PEZI|nr:hypothetical protein QBC38DRAFT_389391 [Podospora fimiseda]